MFSRAMPLFIRNAGVRTTPRRKAERRLSAAAAGAGHLAHGGHVVVLRALAQGVGIRFSTKVRTIDMGGRRNALRKIGGVADRRAVPEFARRVDRRAIVPHAAGTGDVVALQGENPRLYLVSDSAATLGASAK